MNLIVVGTNHKYSPIETREKIAFGRRKLRESILVLLNYACVKGAVILSTCNRVELYASVSDIETGINSLKAFLSDYHRGESGKIDAYLYTYIGKEAVAHLFNVSCGIDSQIVGESQILEQVKFAYGEAKIIEAADKALDEVFNRAIAAGLRVRNETAIQKGDVSLGSLSINFIKKRAGVLKDKKVLIIGVGKISGSVVKCLKNEEVKTVFIANRTIEKAYTLARPVDAEVVGFDKLKEKLGQADIIISAASCPHLILKKEDIPEIKSSLLIIDLGVPRNVEPEVKYAKNVELFHLDDLDFAQDESLNRRRQCVPLVKNIIKEEIEKLCREEALALRPCSGLMVSEAT